MMGHTLYIHVIYLALLLKCVTASEYKWACVQGKCQKERYDPASREPALCLEACKMFCNEYGNLWPKPTGDTNLGNFLAKINSNNIKIQIMNRGQSDDLMEAAGKRFKDMVSLAVPKGLTPKTTGKSMTVNLINNNPGLREFSLDLDENYELKVSPVSAESVAANITGKTFFGIRHGLETLAQLFIYDDIRNQLLIPRDVYITDGPVYPYRGILLDTARNYFSVESIKRTIDAMAATKLNTFHWHVTDSHSFPFVSERRPALSKLGAYNPRKIYTKQAIQEVVQYGLERGVRVMPEFDAPAHVGEGWQDTDLTVCFRAEPWSQYCVEPPCGQFNPTKDELYDYLEDIYADMADSFKPDIFHMGGDEVNENCWNSSTEIQRYMVQNRWDLDKTSFLKLWDQFQKKAQDRAYKSFGKRLPLILWTSTLTEVTHVDQFLNKDDYIIQVWTTGADPQIRGLLQKGYRLIMSNYDALYFDCGFGAWVGAGNNWCSPYIGWQKVYDNSPAQIAQNRSNQVLGGEAALWSEQASEESLDDRLWPRAAALAERLWAEPATGWKDAEYRMLNIRERLVRMEIRAEALQPEWCYQNEGYCYR